MKWWGWGSEGKSFPMESKPDLWPWIKAKLELERDERIPPVSRDEVKLSTPVRDESFINELAGFLKPDQYATDEDTRLLHSYGKSYPDLFRVRRGIVRRAPDLVCFPESHDQVEAVVRAAHRHGVVVVPFGGGTNIVGGVNPEGSAAKMVVTIALARMDRLLALDSFSQTATLQAGALGPKLEADLQARGYSLGHYPDSFEFSTLGGWLATRSAGMQSDAYGKIEDMVVALKLVTPTGTLVTRAVPASSAGPDFNRIVCGSEGTLGVITEATMRVHRAPAVKDYRGYLFPNFEAGVAAAHECIDRGFPPSLVRLQDAGETELAFQMKKKKTGMAGLLHKGIKKYLLAKGYHAPCLLVIGFEGDADAVASVRGPACAIMKKHRGFDLGASVGKTWSADKFNVPYLRDYIMDYGCMADVAETSATWSRVLPLYHGTIRAVKEHFQKDQGAGYIGCHISHTYATGACLYFTYAAKQDPGRELEQYYSYKDLVTETFLRLGGTLSHHHAVGTEHRPWMEDEISPTGVQALRALKASLDPKGIFNPGKLIPDPVTSQKEKTLPMSPRRREAEASL